MPWFFLRIFTIGVKLNMHNRWIIEMVKNQWMNPVNMAFIATRGWQKKLFKWIKFHPLPMGLTSIIMDQNLIWIEKVIINGQDIQIRETLSPNKFLMGFITKNPEDLSGYRLAELLVQDEVGYVYERIIL